MKSVQRSVLFLLLSWFFPLLISNTSGYAEEFDLQNGSTVSEDTHACDTGAEAAEQGVIGYAVHAVVRQHWADVGPDFISFRGCLCSMVNCLRFCHRQRWKRMEEEIANVPDIVVDPAVAAGEPDIPQSGATGGTLSSASRTEAEMRTRYDVEARTSTSNVPTNIPEGAATGGALTSAPQVEAEMRMLYEF